jgi:ribosomal protein S18 acetylase RimI-like enzyme
MLQPKKAESGRCACYVGGTRGTRRMTEFSIAEARRCGAPSLRLSVYASNTGALALYASLDFAETGRQEVVVDGESDRKIIMVKDLR